MCLVQQFNLEFFLAAVDAEPGLKIQSLVGIMKKRFQLCIFDVIILLLLCLEYTTMNEVYVPMSSTWRTLPEHLSAKADVGKGMDCFLDPCGQFKWVYFNPFPPAMTIKIEPISKKCSRKSRTAAGSGFEGYVSLTG